MESSGFDRLNLNEIAHYFEPFRAPLVIQAALLSTHPPTPTPSSITHTAKMKNGFMLAWSLKKIKKIIATPSSRPVLLTATTHHL